jgi:hypothetical protein
VAVQGGPQGVDGEVLLDADAGAGQGVFDPVQGGLPAGLVVAAGDDAQ